MQQHLSLQTFTMPVRKNKWSTGPIPISNISFRIRPTAAICEPWSWGEREDFKPWQFHFEFKHNEAEQKKQI